MDNVAKLNDIKNLIYEAEGLLELAQQRTDRLHALLPLIQEKVDKVCEQLADLDEKPAEPAGVSEQGCLDLQPACPVCYELQDSADTPAEPADYKKSYVTEPAVSQGVTKKPVFCLNDRFKFRRVIFGGSDADFNAAMDFLATLETYEEAEDYFYNDLGLDPAGEDVIEFMDVIKTYYGS